MNTPTAPAPSTPRPAMNIVGWLLTYSATENEFVPGPKRPAGYDDDCEEIAAVVRACDAEIYAQETTERQRVLCDDAWNAVETLQGVSACHAAHHRKQIQELTAEVTRLKQRERICETMDQAEKIALVRALQECAEALGISDTNPTPAALVAAVTAASDAAYIDETEIIGAELAVMCIDGQDMTQWSDACDTVVSGLLKRLIRHRKTTTGEAA